MAKKPSKKPNSSYLNKLRAKLNSHGIPENIVKGNQKNNTNVRDLIAWLRNPSS